MAALMVNAFPAAAEGISGETTVYSNTQAAGDGSRTPDVVAVNANEAVVAWREGLDAGKVDMGVIKYAYTTDGGATWIRPTTPLAATTAEYAWHYVTLYKAGDALYAYLGRVPATSTTGLPVTMTAKRSLDNGHTWQDFAIETPAINNLVTAGRPLTLGSTHIMPIWSGNSSGVLRSTDLVHWTLGGYVPDPSGYKGGEPQIVVDQNDPGTLLMAARTRSYPAEAYLDGPAYAVTSTSTDGGLTWSDFRLDTDIPNYNTKGFLAKDGNGQYLAIYNTAGQAWTGPTPALSRSVLYYKVKRPGERWGAGQFLADGPAVTTGAGAGWDTYAMADEYAPGKYFVAWEHDTSGIKFSKLDVSDAFTNVTSEFDALGGWTTDPGGAVSIAPAGELALRSTGSGAASVSRAYGPPAGFIMTVRGKVTDYSALDPATGTGASLAVRVNTGARQFALSIQSDGVYAPNAGGTWTRILTGANDSEWHTWKAVVDAAGRATLYKDSLETGAFWTVQDSTAPPRTQVWSSGTAADPAAAQVDSFGLSRDITSTTWNDLSGWTATPNGGTVAVTTDNRLRLRNAGGGVSEARRDTPRMCDPTLDFRGQVTDPSVLNTSNGVGTSMAVRVDTGARRLMLTFQSDGVYSIRKGETQWSRVYASTTAGALASWKVVTGSGGEARLYRNGTDTGASWTIQDLASTPTVRHWSSGTASDPAESYVEWTRVTCTD
ncbi:sialidase family protein [Streptomyces sp. NPDC059479]|uniref:sialidase family protein n=1 Tax=Streptomyces sp. NPDC059479 TaxID=3346848 RepID=UPI00368932E5